MKTIKLKLNKFLTTYYLLLTTRSVRGFAILFAVLVSSVILLIALGISNISYREVLLTSEARDAATAFFAADTGAECALYWDRGTAVGSFVGLNQFRDGAPLPTCDGVALEPAKVDDDGFILDRTGEPCVYIRVDKSISPDTNIQSRGHNVECANLADNPRAVQRAIQVTY